MQKTVLSSLISPEWINPRCHKSLHNDCPCHQILTSLPYFTSKYEVWINAVPRSPLLTISPGRGALTKEWGHFDSPQHTARPGWLAAVGRLPWRSPVIGEWGLPPCHRPHHNAPHHTVSNIATSIISGQWKRVTLIRHQHIKVTN